MSAALDALAPNYRRAMERWVDAPTLVQHYAAVAECFEGSAHGLLETVKSYVECVCITVLGEHGEPMPSASPSTSELLVATLRALGISNTRGASKLDKVISAYNRLSDALNDCRNDVGPVAHGKDGFLDTLFSNQMRSYLLTGEALLGLIIAALEGTEPNLKYTREPYEAFTELHKRIDNSVSIEASVNDEDETAVFVLRVTTPGLPDGVELRLEPSRLLYAIDRTAFIEVLAASTTRVLEEEGPAEARDIEIAPAPSMSLGEAASIAHFTSTYYGRLDPLRPEFGRFLRSLSLDPEQSIADGDGRLSDSLLATAENNMGVDWRIRAELQSRMRVSLRRVLVRLAISPAEATNHAEQIVSWLRIQLAADGPTGEMAGG